MSAVEFYQSIKDRKGRVLIPLDYDGTIDAVVKSLSPDMVEPEEGCVVAMEALQKKGDVPFPCSARPFTSLRKGFPIISMPYVANEGHHIVQTDESVAPNLREYTAGPMPDWTATEARLKAALDPEACKLSNEGTAYYCFVMIDDPYYATVQAAFDKEIATLNATVSDKVERIDYGNGVQIALVKRARKVNGLKEFLRLLNIKYTGGDNYDFDLLFKQYIGGVIFFDDSPHSAVVEALQWVKDLKDGDGNKIGFSVKVARPGDDTSVCPAYADQHVENQQEVVAMLQEMAAY